MKKLFLSIILLSLNQFVNAQTNKFELGVEVGPSVASVPGYLPIYFVTGSITAQYDISNIFAIKTGIGYERKGTANLQPFTDAQGNPTSGTISSSDQLQYLMVPILGKFSFGKDIKFIAEAGPYFGYLIKATEVLDITEPSGLNHHGSNDETSHFNTIDIGISAGVGIQIPLSDKLLLEVELRNNLGLANTYPTNFVGQTGPANETLDLLIGFRWTKLFE